MLSPRQRRDWMTFAALLLLAVPLCLAQQVVADESVVSKPAIANTANEEKFQTRTPRYKIAPGDSFDLNFELSPEFNQTAVAVQPDGFVTLRGIGDVKVQGQTVPELTATLRTAYTNILNDPLISVILKDFKNPSFLSA